MSKLALRKELSKLGLTPRVADALAHSSRGESALKYTKDIRKAARMALAAMEKAAKGVKYKRESVISRMHDLLE